MVHFQLPTETDWEAAYWLEAHTREGMLPGARVWHLEKKWWGWRVAFTASYGALIPSSDPNRQLTVLTYTEPSHRPQHAHNKKKNKSLKKRRVNLNGRVVQKYELTNQHHNTPASSYFLIQLQNYPVRLQKENNIMPTISSHAPENCWF